VPCWQLECVAGRSLEGPGLALGNLWAPVPSCGYSSNFLCCVWWGVVCGRHAARLRCARMLTRGTALPNGQARPRMNSSRQNHPIAMQLPYSYWWDPVRCSLAFPPSREEHHDGSNSLGLGEKKTKTKKNTGLRAQQGSSCPCGIMKKDDTCHQVGWGSNPTPLVTHWSRCPLHLFPHTPDMG
jgi:hypothetical protein